MTETQVERLAGAVQSVLEELSRSAAANGPFFSAHEGYAVLLEEVEELWAEVKTNPKRNPDRTRRMREEAVQVAAMALRFLVDIR